jgi:putative ABC transport system permease protein
MIPFTTGQVRLFGATSVNQIVLQVADATQIPTVTADITTLLRQLHRLSSSQPADFTIQSNNDVISRASSVTSTLTALLGGVAAVSLVVGGIGIMNIMLVSVTERTREIGIRLAIGAQPTDVMSQFLIEAVLLSILGGFIGILVGSGVAIAMPYVAGWTTVLPWQAILLAFGVSAIIGMFFGIYPARRASLLDPITALRYE